MAGVRRSIEVPGARSEVAAAWATFVEAILVGRRRLACDESLCVDPAVAELVGFEALDEAHTRVTVTIPAGDDMSVADPGLVDCKVSRDLLLFLDYVESGEYRRRHVRDSVGDASLREDMRRGRYAPRDKQAGGDPLSLRRSGRA